MTPAREMVVKVIALREHLETANHTIDDIIDGQAGEDLRSLRRLLRMAVLVAREVSDEALAQLARRQGRWPKDDRGVQRET